MMARVETEKAPNPISRARGLASNFVLALGRRSRPATTMLVFIFESIIHFFIAG